MGSKILLTIIALLLAIAFLIISCEVENPVKVPVKAEIIAEADKFPMAVGMYWKYDIYNILTGSSWPVEVSIVDSTDDQNGRVIYEWKHSGLPYGYVDRFRIEFRTMVGDSLVRFDSINAPTPSELIVFPLELDQSWTGPTQVDDSSCISHDGSLYTWAEEFETAFRIDRTWNRKPEGGIDSTSTWIVPDVGIVQIIDFKSHSDVTPLNVSQNYLWRLTDYNLYTFGIDEFPQTVGSWWVYEYSDSAYKNFDTIQVSIIDKIKVSGEDATVWLHDYGNWIDTQYVFARDSQIVMYADTLLGYPFVYYDLPFLLGRYWGIMFGWPPPDIIEKGEISVPAGQFSNGFKHHYHDHSPEIVYAHYVDEWFVPGVGMVKRNAFNDYGVDNQEYVLLEYYIAP